MLVKLERLQADPGIVLQFKGHDTGPYMDAQIVMPAPFYMFHPFWQQ